MVLGEIVALGESIEVLAPHAAVVSLISDDENERCHGCDSCVVEYDQLMSDSVALTSEHATPLAFEGGIWVESTLRSDLVWCELIYTLEHNPPSRLRSSRGASSRTLTRRAACLLDGCRCRWVVYLSLVV